MQEQETSLKGLQRYIFGMSSQGKYDYQDDEDSMPDSEASSNLDISDIGDKLSADGSQNKDKPEGGSLGQKELWDETNCLQYLFAPISQLMDSFVYIEGLSHQELAILSVFKIRSKEEMVQMKELVFNVFVAASHLQNLYQCLYRKKIHYVVYGKVQPETLDSIPSANITICEEREKLHQQVAKLRLEYKNIIPLRRDNFRTIQINRLNLEWIKNISEKSLEDFFCYFKNSLQYFKEFNNYVSEKHQKGLRMETIEALIDKFTQFGEDKCYIPWIKAYTEESYFFKVVNWALRCLDQPETISYICFYAHLLIKGVQYYTLHPTKAQQLFKANLHKNNQEQTSEVYPEVNHRKKRSVNKNPNILYRYFTLSEKFDKFQEGEVVCLPGILSTSRLQLSKLKPMIGGEGKDIMEIRLPNLDLSREEFITLEEPEFSDKSQEMEVIFNPSSFFKVLRVTNRKSQLPIKHKYLTLEYIPMEHPETHPEILRDYLNGEKLLRRQTGQTQIFMIQGNFQKAQESCSSAKIDSPTLRIKHRQYAQIIDKLTMQCNPSLEDQEEEEFQYRQTQQEAKLSTSKLASFRDSEKYVQQLNRQNRLEYFQKKQEQFQRLFGTNSIYCFFLQIYSRKMVSEVDLQESLRTLRQIKHRAVEQNEIGLYFKYISQVPSKKQFMNRCLQVCGKVNNLLVRQESLTNFFTHSALSKLVSKIQQFNLKVTQQEELAQTLDIIRSKVNSNQILQMQMNIAESLVRVYKIDLRIQNKQRLSESVFMLISCFNNFQNYSFRMAQKSMYMFLDIIKCLLSFHNFAVITPQAYVSMIEFLFHCLVVKHFWKFDPFLYLSFICTLWNERDGALTSGRKYLSSRGNDKFEGSSQAQEYFRKEYMFQYWESQNLQDKIRGLRKFYQFSKEVRVQIQDLFFNICMLQMNKLSPLALHHNPIFFQFAALAFEHDMGSPFLIPLDKQIPKICQINLFQFILKIGTISKLKTPPYYKMIVGLYLNQKKALPFEAIHEYLREQCENHLAQYFLQRLFALPENAQYQFQDFKLASSLVADFQWTDFESPMCLIVRLYHLLNLFLNSQQNSISMSVPEIVKNSPLLLECFRLTSLKYIAFQSIIFFLKNNENENDEKEVSIIITELQAKIDSLKLDTSDNLKFQYDRKIFQNLLNRYRSKQTRKDLIEISRIQFQELNNKIINMPLLVKAYHLLNKPTFGLLWRYCPSGEYICLGNSVCKQIMNSPKEERQCLFQQLMHQSRYSTMHRANIKVDSQQTEDLQKLGISTSQGDNQFNKYFFVLAVQRVPFQEEPSASEMKGIRKLFQCANQFMLYDNTETDKPFDILLKLCCIVAKMLYFHYRKPRNYEIQIAQLHEKQFYHFQRHKKALANPTGHLTVSESSMTIKSSSYLGGKAKTKNVKEILNLEDICDKIFRKTKIRAIKNKKKHVTALLNKLEKKINQEVTKQERRMQIFYRVMEDEEEYEYESEEEK